MYELPPKAEWPKPGYYYHYKHDASGSVNNYAYYIDAIGHHTEENCRPEDQYSQIYRPLYKEAYVYEMGEQIDNRVVDKRPLHMFFEPAEVNGKQVQRFTRITDPATIAELRKIKHEMYPPYPDE